MPYTIKPTEDLTAKAIDQLVKSIKELVDSYSHKGYDERRIPLLVAFHIADEKRQLQASHDNEKRELQALHADEKRQLQEVYVDEKQRLQEAQADGNRQLQKEKRQLQDEKRELQALHADEKRQLQEAHADEHLRLQETYQLPLQRLVEKLQLAIAEDT